jgi:mannose-6-phosphate isomerase-like protein (cupin superfamily)
MAAPYTIKKLTEVKDSAPEFGLRDFQQARFANDDFECEHTGFTYQRLEPDTRPPFAHRHDRAEEVYVVLSGSGCVKLEDDIVEIGALDAIRVAPAVTRAFEAGPDGLELLAFGARHDGDGEVIQAGGPTDARGAMRLVDGRVPLVAQISRQRTHRAGSGASARRGRALRRPGP